MAKRKRPTEPSEPDEPAGAPAEDVAPADGFTVAPVEDDEPAEGDGPVGDGSGEPEPDGELERLRKENAALKAKLAGRGPEHAGGKYRVSLPDGPTAVVECEPGEHPFEAFKRVTGVIRSDHTPKIEPAKPDAAVGVVKKTG